MIDNSGLGKITLEKEKRVCEDIVKEEIEHI
jgi:hypothetical protein